jgi:hypothetical protein
MKPKPITQDELKALIQDAWIEGNEAMREIAPDSSDAHFGFGVAFGVIHRVLIDKAAESGAVIRRQKRREVALQRRSIKKVPLQGGE